MNVRNEKDLILKATKTYLKGKFVFITSLMVISVTFLVVFVSGEGLERSIATNLYISLGIIATALFFFMFYGLYRGVGLQDNFPKLKDLKLPDAPVLVSDGPVISESGDFIIDGIIGSIIAWIIMTAIAVLFSLIFEVILWMFFFLIASLLYWVFFRALKLMFSKSSYTKGYFVKSFAYSAGYTIISVGWIYAIIFITDYIQ